MNNIETLSSEALVAGQYHGELATKAVIYSLAWSPSSDELIVAATSQGQLLLFDYKKAKLLDRHQPIPNSQAGIHRVTWQPSEYIACGTGDCSLVLFQITEGKLERYRQYYHPKLVYGVAWDPFQKSQIASGCVDSAIRIWDTSNPGETAIATLNGHSARVYNVSWHPQLPCVLASSSDDKDIIVWNTTSQQPLQILRGHTQNARPIQWSSEIPWLILSGSWDSTLRAWDARSGSCLNVVHDHHADIYGLVAHPSKPFTYVSCSRDTSIRFWSLDDLLQPLVLRSLMSQSIGDFLSTPEAAREASEIKLSGRASEELQTRLGNMQEAEKYREILTFFCESIGEVEFFDLIKYHLNGGKFNMNNRVSPLQEIAVSYRSRAEELESSSSFAYLGSALAKKEDRIKEAAKIHLKTGNIKQYCELMIKLGEWERAMAVAPSFCMDYWQYVANRYAEHLLKTENEEAGAVLLATKQVDKAIDFFTNQGDGEDALLIASTRNAGHLQPNATGPIPDYSKPKETGEDITILKQIVKELADHHTERCEPVLAAAYYLAIKDTESAITVLLQANEVLYAYVLTKVMSLKNREVYYRLAKQAMRHELYNLAEEILRPWPEMRELIIASTPILDPGQLYQSKNLLPLEEYTSRGQQHLAS